MRRSAISSSTATSIRRSRILRDVEELRVAGRMLFSRYWSVFGATVIDLTDKSEDPLSIADGFEPVRHRLGIQYEDDCLQIGLTWRRDYERIGTFRAGQHFRHSLGIEGDWPLRLRSAGLDKRQPPAAGCKSREFMQIVARAFRLNSTRALWAGAACCWRLRRPRRRAGCATSQAAAADQQHANRSTCRENPQLFGTAMPSVIKATAIVNGDVITQTDVDQRLALLAIANGGKHPGRPGRHAAPAGASQPDRRNARDPGRQGRQDRHQEVGHRQDGRSASPAM